MVHDIYQHHYGDKFDGLNITGRGGTRIRPSFEAAANLEDEIHWMVCLTDMGIFDFPAPNEAPDYPVIWCATGEGKAPFGTVIRLRPSV